MGRSRTFVKDGKKVRKCSHCGQVKDLTAAYWGRTKNDSTGFRRTCKVCVTKMNRDRRYGKSESEKKQEQKSEGGKMTEVTCSCGHTWSYEVERPSMVDYLKTKPCPSCAMGMQKNTPPPDETPQQKKEREKREAEAEAERKKQEQEAIERAEEAKRKAEEERRARIDRNWVDGILDMLPDGELFHVVLPEVMMCLRDGLALWLQGPPGTSKSTLAEQAARGLGMNFYPLSCHELMTRSDLFGFTDAMGNDHRTPLWDAYEKGGVLLLDEVDNGNPNLLAALNSALSNGHCVFGSGTVVQRHENFTVVATANTAGLGPEQGYIGRNGVDPATRDRFVTFDVPIDGELEAALAAKFMGEDVEDLAVEMNRQRAQDRLEERSINRQDLNAGDILVAVEKVRRAVDSRFRAMSVSPRTTIHAATMVKAGFTLKEALKAKLPGLKPTEVDDVLKEIA